MSTDAVGNKYQIRFQPDEDLFAGIMDETDEIHTVNDTGLEDFFDKTSFIFREGLCGDGAYISIESALHRGMFWRHQNSILKLHKKSDDDLFKQDACFGITKHLCSLNYISESVSFYSRNYVDHLITKCGNQLKIMPETGDNCGSPENRCWVLDKSLVQIVPVAKNTSLVSTKSEDNSVALVDSDDSYQVHMFSQFRVVEGIDGNFIDKTISFESHAKPGFYLTVDSVDSPFQLTVRPDDEEGDYTLRASWLRQSDGLACKQSGSVSLAAAAAPTYYLAFCQNEIMMLLETGNWARCSDEENFDLNMNGCWNLNPYKDEFRVDLFKAEGAHGPRWIHEQVHYSPEEPNYELWFVAESGTSDPDNWGDIAIDDISGYYGECLQQNICTFEDSKGCGFSQEQEDLSDWTIGSFVDDPSGSSPPADHTSGGQTGRTVYYQNAKSDNTSFDAHIRSPQYPPMAEACVSFWYYMWSDEYQEDMEFSVSLDIIEDPEYSLWSRRGWIKQGWVRGTIDLLTEQDAQIVFRARGKNILNKKFTIAFDDYEIDTQNFCGKMDNNVGCDFETGDTCKWSNSEDDDMDWVLGSAGTDTSDTGPNSDHTTQTKYGHYLYIAEKSTATRNKYAILESPVVDVTAQIQPACLTFWYHMYGVDIGTLLVNKVNTISQEQTQVFSKFASQGNNWRLGEVQIDPNDAEAYLYLQMVAVTNDGVRGEIALDDIYIFDGPCTHSFPTNFSCSGSEQVPMEVVCDFHKDCSNGKDENNCGQCDFEHNQCGWVRPFVPSKYQWARKRNATTSGNAPSIDHTTGTDQGWYMIADQTSEEEYLYDTWLVSPLIHHSFSTCEVSLWYYLTRDDQNSTLSVLGKAEQEAWTQYWESLEDTVEWTEARVHLGRQRNPLNLILKAQLGEGNNIIAIDDVTYQFCDFPEPPVNTTCDEEGKLSCDNMACYSNSQKCDLTDDCGDSSDEKDCNEDISCQFEESLCTWENLQDDSADWIISSALDSKEPRGPTRDHTTNTKYGSFLKSNTTQKYDFMNTVRLASQVLTSLDKLCTINMYLYLYPGAKNRLVLYTREAVGGEEKQIFNHTASGNYQYWFKQLVLIPERIKAFQLVMELQINPNTSADIFVDDISISSSCKTDENSLPTVSPQPTTTSDPCYYRCATDNKCLEQLQVCNFHKDCEGGEDENDCGECDFEGGTCGWMDSSASLYGWERKRPMDLTNATFSYPEKDRNNATDKFYMIADVQSPGSPPDPALLISPLIGGSGVSCKIQFWHSLIAGNTELSFMILQDGEVVKVKTITNRDETAWYHAKYYLNVVGSYQLQLQAVFTEGTENILAVAVDDVIFTDCDAANPPDIHLDCDWETDLCSWTQATGSDEADWDRANDGAWFEGTGPGYDHTSGTGYYLYFTSHYLEAGDTAVLATPTIQPTEETNSCLSFWYHIYGMEFDILSLKITRNSEESISLWTLGSSQGNLWKQAFVDVPSGNGAYMVSVVI